MFELLFVFVSIFPGTGMVFHRGTLGCAFFQQRDPAVPRLREL